MKPYNDPEVKKHLAEARRQIMSIRPRGPITEKIDWKSLSAVNLAAAIFKGTDIPDLANYPKKPKTQF